MAEKTPKIAGETSKIVEKNVENSRKKTPKVAGETSKTPQLSLKAQRKSGSVNTQLDDEKIESAL